MQVERGGVVVDRTVLGRAGKLLRHPPDVLAHAGVRRLHQGRAMRRHEMRIHRGQQLLRTCRIRRVAEQRPALRVEEYASFDIGLRAKHHIIVGDAARVPLAIPEMPVHRRIAIVRAFTEKLSNRGIVVPSADIGPQLQGVGRRQCQPARYAATLVANHVHRVAPVALRDVAQPACITRRQQPAHGGIDTLGDAERVPGMILHRHFKQRVIAGFIQVGLQEDRQPHAMVGVWNLVDVFQLRPFDQQDAIRHRATGFLLRQRAQQGGTRRAWLQVGHAHVVLQQVAGLRIGGQAIDAAVVVDLPRKPVVGECVQPCVRRPDFDATTSRIQIAGIVTGR